MKKLIGLLFVSALLSTVNAQVKSIGDFFGSGAENAEILFENYFAPWTNAIGANLNTGWYNTAKPHKSLGFDITITPAIAFVPEEDKTFDLSAFELDGISFPNGSITPTVAGSRDDGQLIRYTPVAQYPTQNVEFNAPMGTGVSFMPTPIFKIGIGIIKETELDFRYIPNFSIGDFGEMGLWGVGIKHSVKQWIPVLSKVPVLQLGIQGGYTKFSTRFDLSVTPESYNPNLSGGSGNYEDQQIALEVKSLTANIIVGADLPVIDFYGGIGFATTNANLSLDGTFPIPTVSGGQLTVEDIENPIDAKITNSDGNKTKPRVNVGMRIKLGILTIHGDYTYANYSVVNTGIGISFR